MMRLFYISTLSLSFMFFGCAEAEKNNENFSVETVHNELPLSNLETSNALYYQGNSIKLTEEGMKDEVYTIPEITLQREDISFRAKRIPTELYLKNRGLSDEALTQALAEAKGEQLFYFEFEEQQKQDLIKKYLEDNLDANIAYLSFSIFKDFALVNSKLDTIPSAYSLYERNFHVAPYERLILSFNGVDQDEEIKLIYKDQLFGRGKLEFAFASTQYLENNIKNPS